MARRNPKFTLLIVLGMMLVANFCFAEPIPDTVAVLDFTAENGAPGDWTAGLSDFLEMTLQSKGVVTLERRQIRLILAERKMSASGFISAQKIREAKLPHVSFLISGAIRRLATNQFEMRLALVRAENAEPLAVFTSAGSYPNQLNGALDDLCGKIIRAFSREKPRFARQSEFLSLTWIPEAAQSFFKGIQFYTVGDFPRAFSQFFIARTLDEDFTLAQQWEARALRAAGFPELAEIASATIQTNKGVAKSPVSNTPVVAVVVTTDLPNKGEFLQALASSPALQLFDPNSINATARELDLQLTGQMSAPLNEKSVWLAVDYFVHVTEENGVVTARMHHLLSGETLASAQIPSVRGQPGEFQKLAKNLLANWIKTSPSQRTNFNSAALPEIADASDSFEIKISKAMRLAQQEPNNARHWIALGDLLPLAKYQESIWSKAVEILEKNPEQPDASFLMASALWRNRSQWTPEKSLATTLIPLTNFFAPLLKTFPASRDAFELSETIEKIGSKARSSSTNRRYYASMSTNLPVRFFADHTFPVSGEPKKFADLTNSFKKQNFARARALSNDLIASKNEEVRKAAWEVISASQKMEEQQKNALPQFQAKAKTRDDEATLAEGDSLLRSPDVMTRGKVIRKMGDAVGHIKGPEAKADFVLRQSQELWADYLGTTDYDQHIAMLEYLTTLGELAEQMLDEKKNDFARKCFLTLRDNTAVPLENRLTAQFDLASLEYEEGNYFNALELLREVLEQCAGRDLSIRRKTGGYSTRIEDAARNLTRRIRLFASREALYTECCGRASPVPLPAGHTKESMEKMILEFRERMIGGVGADNRSVQAEVLARKDELLPILRYMVWQINRTEPEIQKAVVSNAVLLLCGMLEKNAAELVPYIVPLVASGESQNNAINALGSIGRPAACAVPMLILSSHELGYWLQRNSTWALSKIGPASRESIPLLAQMLYHPNNAVCAAAAKAIQQAVAAPGLKFAGGKSSEDTILAARQWWRETGVQEER
ncbi:MAG: CsgG/HfaB family protein [Verrucomicrobiota bacterium]